MMTRRINHLASLIVLLAVIAGSRALAFDPEAVERLKAKPVCVGCDLSKVSIEEAYMPGAILKNSDLSGAVLWKRAQISMKP